MMNNIWLIIFVGSLTALCLIVFRIRIRWFKYALINIGLAAIVLFGLNESGLLGDYAIPINLVTVGTAGFLGLPGLALLFAVKLVII